MRNDILLRRGILKNGSIQYLEYIESTGDQDVLILDYNPNPKTYIEAEIEFIPNAYSNLSSGTSSTFIGAIKMDKSIFGVNHGGGTAQKWQFFIWNSVSQADGGAIESLTTSEIKGKTKLIWDASGKFTLGKKSRSITPKKNVNGNLGLFGHANTGTIYNRFNLRVYSFKIYEDGKLLLDLKPFQDGNNNGLIDIINNKIYISNIPFETSDQIINNNYIIIKNSYYIDQTPIQYIDTGIVVEDTDDIFIDVEFFEDQTNKNSGTNVLAFGWALGAWNEAPQCLLRDNYNQSTNKYSLWYGSTDYISSSNIPRCKVLISPQNKICQLNGINVSNINFTNAYPNGNSNITPYIGTTHWKKSGVGKQGADCKVYEYYVKDKNGNYKIHLKPKLINGRACMYDSVSGREFYDENGRDFGYFIDGKLKE